MDEITIGTEFPQGWPKYGSWHVLTRKGKFELYRLEYSIYGGGTSWVCKTPG